MMITKTTLSVFLLLCLLAVFTQAKSNVYSDIEILSIDRTIDTTQNVIVRHEVKCTIQNVGSSDTKLFYLAFPKELALNNVAFVSARQQSTTLVISKHKFSDELNKDALFYEIELASALTPKQKVDLVINIALTNTVHPFPKEIKQDEHQKVVHEDNAYFFTPYKVKSQITLVKLGTSAIESYTSTVKPVENKGNGIQYGPFRDATPFTTNNIRLHYVNDRPCFVVSSVERIVELSHWGNLAVEEHYEIKHTGAKLVGPFSRFEYSKNPQQTSPSSFRKITATLPLLSTDIYFRDRIGNISSSDIRVAGKNLEVDFHPRFPLFGGWKIRFYIGYNLPINDYLTVALNNPEKHKLRYKFSIPFDAPVEDLTLRVIVPEGADEVEFRTSFPLDSEGKEILKTYLDVTGRTVSVINKKNVVPEHNENFLLSYTFPSTGVYFEPMLIISALFAFCVLVMVYVRLDLSIHKSEEDLEKEREITSYELTELYIEKFIERDNWYQEVEQAIASNDQKTVDAVEKKRQEMSEFIKKEIITELTNLNAKSLAHIIKVEKKEAEKFEIIRSLSQMKKKEGDEWKKQQDSYDRTTDEIYITVDILRE